MTKSISNTAGVVYVAIDIAKLKHDVLVKGPDGKCKAFKVANCHSNFTKLAQFLESFKLKDVLP